MPRDRLDVTRVTVPVKSSAAVPRLTDPSKNSAVPVGIPPVLVVTAVKVTGAPWGAGLAEEVTVGVVTASVTVKGKAMELLPLLSMSPE